MFSIITLHLVTYKVKEENEHGGVTFLLTLFPWKTLTKIKSDAYFCAAEKT